jgi:Flp pilus assembly protein CpaB
VTTSALIGAGGLVRPGDYVDVILTVKFGSDQIGRIILQNLEVLALDQELEKVAPTKVEEGKEAQTAAGEGKTNSEAVTVTLAVMPVEGEVLTMAEECAGNFGGRLTLALRPFGEHTTVEVRSTWPETGTSPVCSQLFGAGLTDLGGNQGESSSQSPVAP